MKKEKKTAPRHRIADLGFARVDLGRHERQGVSEVIFAPGKTPQQMVEIARRLYQHHRFAMITRLEEETAALIQKSFEKSTWHAAARILTIGKHASSIKSNGFIAVLCAGTSDLPVAEEAAVTAETLGQKVRRYYDVGVAGLHRLLAHEEELRRARVLIVVAGMEGALPSVVAGLVDRPVIAVPTSIGYGASFGGIASLLGMLNSCASGVSVVNIDNGFGAAFAAMRILRAH